MTAISRSKVDIYVVATGTNASALTSTDIVKGEIKTYNKSGGTKDVESDPVFGGYIDKEKPIEQVEISFEIVPSLENPDRWDAMFYALDSTGVYTLASSGTGTTQPTDRAVFIEAVNGTDYKSLAFNNCSVTLIDIEHSADDNRMYNMTLKFSPETGTGVSNFMTKGTSVAALPAWTALDNN